jgi:hypothetical protein
METTHTLSEVLKRLTVDIDNMNSFLFSLENILQSKSENVSITQKNEAGDQTIINVPSFGYLKGQIEDIKTNFETLLSVNNNVIGIKSSNGDVRKFELKKTSQLISDLEKVENSTLNVPSQFRVKNNWFFESFLNPLLYVGLDISSILTDDIDQFAVKRIIINAVNNDDAANFFDQNYKGVNDILLSDLRIDLDANSIDYFEDDNIVDVDVAINRFRGSFDVLRIFTEEDNSGNSSIIRRRYKLSTLTYTDSFLETINTRILAEGDILLTSGDSEYRVVSVNKTNTEVVLERIFGIESITIGANILKIKPFPFRSRELKVNVGYNEREIIFIKPISKSKNLTIDTYSRGVAIFTNELIIPLQDDSQTTLERYYNNFVSDFGLILLSMAKEKKLPAIIGQKPLPPVLNELNFKVVQIDSHIQDSQNITALNSTIKEKAQVEKEVQEVNKKIESLKAKIIAVAKTPQESKRLEKELSETFASRNEKITNLSTLVTNATLQINTTPQFVNRKKYSVRGFWPIPAPISTVYGPQNVVQFKYRFRYLSQSGNQPAANQQNFIDLDGASKSATFSPWEERLTKPRVKELDPQTGLYKWTDEIVSDADQVNTNQLDIPIRKGEIVEIQIKSLSEAGWPDNAVESDWSESIQVTFPEEISSEEEGTVISQKLFADQTRLDFEKSLISRGIDTHVANQFTTGERFFAHKAEDIASGFYTGEGNVIDLFEQLKAIKTTLEAVQQSINLDRGVIKVSIIDPSGNITEVNNGNTINLFAGYYKDLIKDTTGNTVVYNEGKVITKQYTLSIQNTSASLLQLISYFPGNIGIDLEPEFSDPIANPDNDYHVNRRYDIVPLGVNRNQSPLVNKTKQIASRQSTQVKSQFIFTRVRNYGLSEEIYQPSVVADYSTSAYFNTGYSYDATIVSGVPSNWGHYLPYSPTLPLSATNNSRVWDGTLTSGIANGGGKLSEFCISKDHPLLKGLTTPSTIDEVYRPQFDFTVPTAVSQVNLPFAHALHFETSISEDTNQFGAKYYMQASRVAPAAPVSNPARNDSNYPIKLGFTQNDEFLIGKYTCGAYLYMLPQDYESISVEGNLAARSTKNIKFGTENSINIPIIFQFRASDKLGFIGGFRTGVTLNNIRYQKKIGIDIIVKDESPFSFDLEIGTQYIKETSLDAPLVQGTGTTINF